MIKEQIYYTAGAGTTIIASDLSGLSAHSPFLAGIIAAAIGVAVGTVPWQMAMNRPIRKIKAIVGYIFVLVGIVFVTQDISPDDVLAMTGSPNIASFWRSSIGFRYAIIGFAITQIHYLPVALKAALRYWKR